MGYAPSALANCPDIQAELDQYFLTCNSSMLRESTPLFDFLMSSVNRSGYSQLVSPGRGKLKTVQLRYDQRLLESEVTEPGTCDRSCVATAKRGDLTNTCEIDPCDYMEVSEVWKAQDFALACRDNPQIVAKKMAILANALVAKAATRVSTDVIALNGNWGAMVPNVTADFLQVKTKKDGTEDTNGAAFEDIDAALALTEYCNNAAIFSGINLWKYYRLMNAGCCAADGLDLSQILSLYGKAVLYDKRVQKAFGDADKAIAIQPGSVQVVTYNEADTGINPIAPFVGANYYTQLIFDPQSGLPIDLTISDDCGNVSVFMRANVKVCGLPTDLFKPGDDMEGVVYVNGIEVANV